MPNKIINARGWRGTIGVHSLTSVSTHSCLSSLIFLHNHKHCSLCDDSQSHWHLIWRQQPGSASISYSGEREDGLWREGEGRLFKGWSLKQWGSDLNTPHTLKHITPTLSLSLTPFVWITLSLPVKELNPGRSCEQWEEDKEPAEGELSELPPWWRGCNTEQWHNRPKHPFLGFCECLTNQRSSSSYLQGLVRKVDCTSKGKKIYLCISLIDIFLVFMWQKSVFLTLSFVCCSAKIIFKIVMYNSRARTVAPHAGFRGDDWLLNMCKSYWQLWCLRPGANMPQAKKDSHKFCQVVYQYYENQNCPSVC